MGLHCYNLGFRANDVGSTHLPQTLNSSLHFFSIIPERAKGLGLRVYLGVCIDALGLDTRPKPPGAFGASRQS